MSTNDATELLAKLAIQEESTRWWGRFAAKETTRANKAERKLAELLSALSHHKQQLAYLGLPLGDRLENAVLSASAEGDNE